MPNQPVITLPSINSAAILMGKEQGGALKKFGSPGEEAFNQFKLAIEKANQKPDKDPGTLDGNDLLMIALKSATQGTNVLQKKQKGMHEFMQSFMASQGVIKNEQMITALNTFVENMSGLFKGNTMQLGQMTSLVGKTTEFKTTKIYHQADQKSHVISYELPEGVIGATLEIWRSGGGRVATIPLAYEPGRHEATWKIENNTEAPEGLYHMRVQTANGEPEQPVVLYLRDVIDTITPEEGQMMVGVGGQKIALTSENIRNVSMSNTDREMLSLLRTIQANFSDMTERVSGIEDKIAASI